MKVWICAATQTEAGVCKHVFESRREFSIVKTGVGLDRARSVLGAKLREEGKPDWIISTGFAGALDDGLRPFSWVTAQKVFFAESPRELQVLASQVPDGILNEVSRCGLISAPELTLQNGKQAAQMRATLAKQYPQIRVPLVVDMESAALAEIAEDNEIAFGVVRMITDSPKEPLPRFVGTIASAMATQSRSRKASLYVKGAVEISGNLRGALFLAKAGPKWTKEFEQGWQKILNNGFLVTRLVDEAIIPS